MGQVLSFTHVARRIPAKKKPASPSVPAGEADIVILPSVRIERHNDLILQEDTPPQGPRPRPRRKRA